MVVDPAGSAWLTGSTSSVDFPATVGALGPDCAGQGSSCNSQAFISGLDPGSEGAQSLVFSLRFGGESTDVAHGVATDSFGRLAVVGTTQSDDFPTTASAFRRTVPFQDSSFGMSYFVSVVDPSSTSPLVYSTFLGGAGQERWPAGLDGGLPDRRVFADDLGRVTFLAETSSSNFPTTDGAFDRSVELPDSRNRRSVFVTVDPARSGDESLAFSSYVGGSATSVMRAFEHGEKFILGGITRDPDFLTTSDAFDRSCGFGALERDGSCASDAFVAVVDAEPGPTLSTDSGQVGFGYVVPMPLPAGEPVQISTSDPQLPILLRTESEEGWLAVSSKMVTGAGAFDIIADPSSLLPGSYSGTVILQSDAPLLRRSILVNLTVAWPPPGEIGAVVNAASLLPGPVAPGQLVSVFGSGLGSAGGAAATAVPFQNILGAIPGVRVQVRGRNTWHAPALFARHDQVNAVVPYEIDGQPEVSFTVLTNTGRSSQFDVPTAPSAPGLFTLDGTGQGQLVALNEDGSLNSPDNPAAAGSIVVLYGTGEGQTDPAGVTGSLAAEPLRRPVLPVQASVGDEPATVLFAGAAPGFAGLLQANVRLSPQTPAGSAEVWIQVGQARSQPGVTIAVR